MAAKRKMVKDRLGKPVEHYDTYLNHMLEKDHLFECPTCGFKPHTADDIYRFCPRCGFTGNAYEQRGVGERGDVKGKQVSRAQPGV